LEPLIVDARWGQRTRGEAWLPEMTWAFLQPGTPAIDCGTLDEFLGALEALDWRSYEDFPLPPVPTPRR
jgi:hypothetical protein